MKKIMILGGGPNQIPLIKAAKKNGYGDVMENRVWFSFYISLLFLLMMHPISLVYPNDLLRI